MFRNTSSIKKKLLDDLQKCSFNLYGSQLSNIPIISTKDKIEGDFSVIIIPFLKLSDKDRYNTASDIGNELIKSVEYIDKFDIIGNYLNLTISDEFYIDAIYTFINSKKLDKKDQKILVEFSSPNTNKPLHLGHIRNCLLGDAISRILSFVGYEVFKTQIVNDRGIHICKSMLAWQNWANNENPKSQNIKGDKFVGYYYTLFEKKHREQLLSKPSKDNVSQLLKEAKQMLVKWENKDDKIISLWNTINSWVYEGIDKTYKALNISFDKSYYESQTYLKGKDVVQHGLKKGIFYSKDDGSVWVDLSDEGLDSKLLLRSDKTSVYITQDIGTAIIRHDFFPFDKSIYVVGNEQDYHFEVLFAVFKKLGYQWADNMYHLSYGMVDLPDGKMKSREGNVVDADDLIQDMFAKAEQMAKSINKDQDSLQKQTQKDYEKIGMAALKYYILKVDPKKRILFDPNESIDFNGNTGPFVQYAYVRINSLIKKANVEKSLFVEKIKISKLLQIEKEIIKKILDFEDVIALSANKYNPSILANYCYETVKKFNAYYQNTNIIKEKDVDKKKFKLQLIFFTGELIKKSFQLLGIEMPSRM